MASSTNKLKEGSRQFGERWGQAIIKRKWLVIAASLVVFIGAASGGLMKFNGDYHVFFSKDNPQLLAYDALQNTYTKDDNVFIMIEKKDGSSIFDAKTLAAVEKATKEAWQTPYSSRVDAVTNFQYTRAVNDDLYVDDFVSGALDKSSAELEKLKRIAIEDSRIVNRLVNKDATTTAINITVRLPDDASDVEQKEIKKFVVELTDQLEKENPELKTYLSGLVMMNNAFFEASEGDVTTLIPLMFLIVFISILISTRTFSGLFAAILVIIFSIASTMGLGATLGIQLTPPSASFIQIILTLAVADSIHILITFIQGMRKGLTKNEAIVESLRVNFMPVFITSLTTVIGFLSMNTSDSPPFRDLGNLTSIGMTAAFLFSVTLLPAMLSALPVWVKAREEKEGKTPILERLAEFVIAYKRPVVLASAGFIIVTSFLTFQNELNDEFVKYFSKTITFRTDTDHISDNLTGIYTQEYALKASEPGGVNDPEYLQKLKEFETWLYTNPEVIHVNAFTDVMRHVNKSMHGDSLKYFKIPDTREEAAQFLFLYEMSLPYGLDLNNQVNVDKSETRVIVTINNIPTKRMLELAEMSKTWLKENTPEYMHTEAVSSTMMFAHLSKRQILSMISGTGVAILLISIVLGIAIRSAKFGFISLIPNITPVIAGLGMWGLFYGYINTGISIVFGMTLGIIVDDTVHYLSKYLRARRELGLSPEDSVRYAFSTVGQALVVTSVVLIAGFLVLAQSNFGLNSDMAKITGLIIALALVLDFFMLPAMLILFRTKRKQDEKDERAEEAQSPELATV